MFDGKYFDWNQKRVKGIVDQYGYKFFYGKKIADLGCGHGDISGTLYRLGAEITAVDARQEHLKVLSKKFPGVKVIRANLDGSWPFTGSKFDMVLDLGLICHLSSIDEHLKAVCSSTSYLVLETAVLDSNDPYTVVSMPEGKEIYDLAYSGTGCRPSAAYIERILTECGMSFKRMDIPKFNSGEYKYDWASQNDNSTNFYKRRIWFAVKNEAGLMLPYVGAQPAVVVQPPSAPNFHFGSPNIPSTFVSNIQTSGVPTVLTATPRPPMHSRLIAEGLQHPGIPTSLLSNNYKEPQPNTVNFEVMKNSKEFALLSPEIFETPVKFETAGVIFPNSPSSRMWIRKIAPFFPNLSVSSKALPMIEFKTSKDAPNVIMCSLDSLIVNGRIWIDEWFSGELTQSHLQILRQCKTILTPSLLNAQEILSQIPDANVLRIDKAWPMLKGKALQTDYFLYFEKDENVTRLLLESWEERFGKIVIVGTRVKLPKFAEFVSETVSFTGISNLLMGAKAVIDISTNTYYMSGILKLAGALSVPIVTNNQAFLNLIGSVMITHSNSKYPLPADIHKAVNTFINETPKTSAQFNETYNNNLVESIQKLVGA